MAPTSDTMDVVYVMNSDFKLPFLSSIESIEENTSTKTTFHVLHNENGISTEELRIIDSNFKSNFASVKIDGDTLEKLENERFGVESFYKLLIPDKLKGKRKAIYLDCDTIVEADLYKLYQKNLDGYPLAAVQDLWIPYVSDEEGVTLWDEIGLDKWAPLFNSGVLLLDLNKLRGYDLLEKSKEYIIKAQDEVDRFEDQRVLNAVLAGSWKQLDPTWNVSSAAFANGRAPTLSILEEKGRNASSIIDDAKILHYTGLLERPWKPESLFSQRAPHPERDTFNHYLRTSGWFSTSDWYKHQLSFYGGRVSKTLRDLTRPMRHKLRTLTATYLGVDPSFLGGEDPLSID